MAEKSNGALALMPKVQTTPVAYSQADYVRWQIVGDDVTPDEFDYFLAVAKHLDLDPLRRQIYCVKRGKKAVVQTGIDGYRVIAARTSQLAGIDDAEFGAADKDGHPAWARVVVWRMVHGQRCPFTATARWQEYRQVTGQGALMSNWKNMPFLMLAKCAEALALRKAFPEALSGIYTDSELGTEVVGYQPQPQHAQPASAKAADSDARQPNESWRDWCKRLGKRLGIFDTLGDYYKLMAQVTSHPNPAGVVNDEAVWQAWEAYLLHEIEMVEGMAQMAGLDDQAETEAE